MSRSRLSGLNLGRLVSAGMIVGGQLSCVKRESIETAVLDTLRYTMDSASLVTLGTDPVAKLSLDSSIAMVSVSTDERNAQLLSAFYSGLQAPEGTIRTSPGQDPQEDSVWRHLLEPAVIVLPTASGEPARWYPVPAGPDTLFWPRPAKGVKWGTAQSFPTDIGTVQALFASQTIDLAQPSMVFIPAPELSTLYHDAPVLGGTGIAEVYGVGEVNGKIAEPGCAKGNIPLIRYARDNANRVDPVIFVFFREHEFAHFLRGHVRCENDAPVWIGSAKLRELDADCEAARLLIVMHKETALNVVHEVIGGLFWRSDEGGSASHPKNILRYKALKDASCGTVSPPPWPASLPINQSLLK